MVGKKIESRGRRSGCQQSTAPCCPPRWRCCAARAPAAAAGRPPRRLRASGRAARPRGRPWRARPTPRPRCSASSPTCSVARPTSCCCSSSARGAPWSSPWAPRRSRARGASSTWAGAPPAAQWDLARGAACISRPRCPQVVGCIRCAADTLQGGRAAGGDLRPLARQPPAEGLRPSPPRARRRPPPTAAPAPQLREARKCRRMHSRRGATRWPRAESSDARAPTLPLPASPPAPSSRPRAPSRC